MNALEQIGQAIAGGQPPQIALPDGFNVQPVTERFFKDYKAAYDATAAAYTQTLFNRLLFVHFVSRKGWLAFNGNKDYLNTLWHDYRDNPASDGFYAQRLDALFYDGMNTPPEQRRPGIDQIIGQALPQWRPVRAQRPGSAGHRHRRHIIAALLSHDGLFNRYNFTVTEATPLDTEVGVDPEMLGKLFEETVNARHSSGTYYTPRPVVSFMCRAPLKGYLAGRNIPNLAADKEEIAPPEYKQFLLKAYAAAVGRSDLYCYFYARGLQLLKEGGMHIFVWSNRWVDVGYGARLHQYLLDNATQDAIYESAVARQFPTADINTIISVIRKRPGTRNGDDSDADATRFVQLRAPLATALADDGRRQEIVKTRAELRAAATSGRVYEALGLTADERAAVQAGVTELVTNRKRRAASV